MITLKAIAIRNTSRAPMQLLDGAEVTVKNGINGDFRGAQGNRQVTVLSQNAWLSACESIDAELVWTVRRANLLIEGVEFSAADVGKTLRIGDLALEITQQTDPCSLMDKQYQGLRAALTPDWRGGVCCKVMSAGSIRPGDQVELLPQVSKIPD